jgi:predicted  nucleic acid-binding Zn-ribbon protein
MGLTPCQRIIDQDSGRREYCVMEERLAKLEALSDSTVSAVAALRTDMNDRFTQVDAQFAELRRQKADTQLIQSKLDAQARQTADLRQEMDRRFAETHDQITDLRQDMDRRFAETHDQIAGVQQDMDRRFAEARETTNLRFDIVDRRMDGLEHRISEQGDQIKALRSDLSTLTRWLVGLQITILLFMVGMYTKLLPLA